MGNCLKKDFDNQWGGDYWGSPPTSPERALLSSCEHHKAQKKVVAGDGDGDEGFSPSSSDNKKRRGRGTTEVKIKITKKQLEELLGMQEMQGLTLQQVLTRLMNSSNLPQFEESNQPPWRPNLHSIPE